MKFTEEDVYTVGERINTVERLFNMNEGMARADDNLPARFANEAAPSDPTAITIDVLAVMDEYYAEREYDENGVPTPALLARLGLLGGSATKTRRSNMRLGVTLFGPYAKLLPPGSAGRPDFSRVPGAGHSGAGARSPGRPGGGTHVRDGERPALEPASPVGDGDEIRVIVPLGGG